jgi:hypothetical protein
MHSCPKKSFRVETDCHSIVATYQPSNIQFAVTDRRNNRTSSSLYYDSTLPDSVKEECEAVADLFDYLQDKPPQEMQVEGNSLRFKVVRIKKERWYSLDIQPVEVAPIEEEKME